MDSNPAFPNLETVLSLDRFGTYLAWAEGDRERAIALYSLNTTLSESLYTPLQALEISLRNRIHSVMTDMAGERWFDDPTYQLNPRQGEMLAKAEADLRENRKETTPGAMVAGLTFGFWTAMLGREYEELWQTDLHQIAKRESGKGLRRKDFTRPLGPIRTLRNRIAHHEPILYWNLQKHHESILQIIRWLSEVAADWCVAYDRFPHVYPDQRIVLAGRSHTSA